MPSYAYRAISRTGRSVRGQLVAPTLPALGKALHERGLLLVDASEKGPDTGSGLGLGRASAVLSFTRTVSTLLSAGLPLSRALAGAQHTARGAMKGIVQTVRLRVDQGDGIAQALAEHVAFPLLHIGMVRAGERSGDLPGAFRRLSDHLEREAEFRSRLISASVYPVVLLVAGSAAVLMLLFFVIPRFAEILEGAGASLPRSTSIVLWVGKTLQQTWVLLPILGIAALLAAIWVQTSQQGRRAFAVLLLKSPFGGLRRQALTARFARILGILLGGGAPLMSALSDTAQSTPDPLMRAEVERAAREVREGRPLHEAIGQGPFSPLLAEMVAVGEESGRIEELLLKTAEILDRDVERTVQRATVLIEPLLIVVFGIVVAVIALSLMQAVYGVNAAAFR
jgi:general secretion pathway protein F